MSRSPIAHAYNLRTKRQRALWTKVFDKKAVFDANRYPLQVIILGSHLSETDNAPPYYRMTQRSLYQDPGAARYQAWKQFVQQQWQLQTRRPLPSNRHGAYGLNVRCFFTRSGKRTCTHADPDNVRKGIQDALFYNGDQHVIGAVSAVHVKDKPRVEIVVWKK